MKRGASFISSFLLFVIALAFVLYLTNPSAQNANWFNQVFSVTNLLNGITSFFTNPANWAILTVSAGISFFGGGNFIVTLIPIVTSLLASQALFGQLFNSMFPGTDPISWAVRFVATSVMGIGIFIGIMILFRGIIED